ncbi:hypothetical protein [Celeribacter naphthalenivorans]|uniref:hypothetical protein n=1 Tax=Celeribacter naphthalenivorans TaxID=1614694 RepID=UPI001CFBA12D|nr:hypothetical protein [Celeribacter naphthalenivorans]
MKKVRFHYIPPPCDESDFKELFLRMARLGAGLPLDKDGATLKVWTPELLASAIESIPENKKGIDIRTVQMWFQDTNDAGISPKNIRWLAVIFGCGDPEATRLWQKELFESRSRLFDRRKNARSNDTKIANKEKQQEQGSLKGIVGISIGMFATQNALIIPAILWTGFGVLAFLSFIAGVESVTYSPYAGMDKQIGFLWAPSWTVLPVFILPAIALLVSKILSLWSGIGRPLFNSTVTGKLSPWEEKASGFRLAFTVTFFASFGIIFALQWAGVYLQSYHAGNNMNLMVDWNIAALVRPEAINAMSNIILSFVAYAYFGFVMWVYFNSLLILYLVCDDLADMTTERWNIELTDKQRAAINDIFQDIFRVILLAVVLCTFIRLQSTYLIVDAPNILSWLYRDASSIFVGEGVAMLETKAIARFTSLILVFLSLFVFTACVQRIRNTGFFAGSFSLFWKGSVLTIMTVNLLLVGNVNGFTWLLLFSSLLGIYAIFDTDLKGFRSTL